MGGKVFGEDSADIFFGAARRWAIVVREIEMGDASIEGAPEDGAGFVLVIGVAEVMPASERDLRQVKS